MRCLSAARSAATAFCVAFFSALASGLGCISSDVGSPVASQLSGGGWSERVGGLVPVEEVGSAGKSDNDKTAEDAGDGDTGVNNRAAGKNGIWIEAENKGILVI